MATAKTQDLEIFTLNHICRVERNNLLPSLQSGVTIGLDDVQYVDVFEAFCVHPFLKHSRD
jgi:hypothetical protein